MSENLKELLRKVYSIDTEAGHKLKYHIIRALACEDYIEEIGFEEHEDVPNTIGNSFLWGFTLEGVEYWSKIDMLIDDVGEKTHA